MLKTRVLTGMAGIPLLLFFVYVGGYWFGLLVLVIALAGLKEYYALIHVNGWKTLELWGFLFLPLALWAVYWGNLALILFLWLFLFLVFGLLLVFFYPKIEYREPAIIYWGLIYTGGLPSFLVATRLLADGFLLTVFFFVLIWSSDIFAYFIGTSWGKIPLAKSLSPKKTVEGMVGGLAGGILVGLLLAWFFSLPFLSIKTGAVTGLIISATGALGDLFQSALKRSAHVKDSGNFLPGHGGILDRFDSLFFAAPFFYLFMRLVGS